jgi:hypothetical protein
VRLVFRRVWTHDAKLPWITFVFGMSPIAIFWRPPRINTSIILCFW